MAAPQEISLYAQLRKLRLCDCPPALSLDGFLDALAASVQLEELTLQGAFHRLLGEWPHGDPVPHRPPVSLPRLRSCRFYEYRIDRLSYFLAHLHLQPSAIHRIQGEVSCLHGAPKTIHAMLPPNRSATLPALSLATNINMTICGNQYSIGCRHTKSSVDRPAGDSPRVLLMLTPSGYDWPWDRSMAQGLGDLVEAFGSSPLTRLTIRGDQSNSTAAVWERVFRTFPLLEELDLEGPRHASSNVRDVFRGLHAASAPHTERESESRCTVACPNLRDIRLVGVATPSTYKAMHECLRYRGDRGVVLESLKMKSLADCYRDEDEDEDEDDNDNNGDGDSLRRGFIEGVSDVVKSIEARKTMSELEAEYQELDVDSDV
ncbi:hypothetical protein GSI_03448 [Ganoderma sinense ZZ0214-1]|uniref:Uncharacterized protein n=1 Tax=Ganoderma sinense ZZ0214-1 TaxID=1077348 RepID=A0A2G8SM64_9APHY|nr:hypothetical protein GSI_03448 [Ganoderma sinense ZZ0214-1]